MQSDFGKGTAAILAARERLATAEAVLLDWDGCVAVENKPVPAALKFLHEWHGRAAIVSNNSTHFPADFSNILAKAGVNIAPEQIILAGVEALHHAMELGDQPVLLLADSRMKAYGRKLGLNIVKDHAKVVLLLRDTRLTYLRLERAVNSLACGARLIVSNPDANHRGAVRRIVPETGALLAAILASLDNTAAKIDFVGKPHALLFQKACAALGVGPEKAVMIGDNPATDIKGARENGLAHIQIGNGIEFDDLLRVERWNGI